MNIFDRLAQRYDLWYEKPFGRSAFSLERECLKRLLPEEPFKGLEVGVGTGRFARALGFEFGVDPSHGMLRMAKGRDILCVQGVGESLPFKDESFDALLMVVTICFVKDPEAVIRESIRVLKSRGALVLGFIPKESPWADFYKKKAEAGHPIYKHARFYPFGDVVGMLEEVGFKVDRILTTLMENPQEEVPISNREVKEGFDPEGGFVCLRGIKI